MNRGLVPIDSPMSEGHTREYPIPCRICGEIQIRNKNIKEATCFNCRQEMNREYHRKLKGKFFKGG